MPQATPELRAKFPGMDTEALEVLADNFGDERGVIFQKNPDYIPTQREFDAINYLIQEWDYGFRKP